jgi:nicotinamidase-related amidase
MADLLELPYLVTEQYPKGLGRTDEVVASAMSDRSRRVEKTRFSALVDVVDEQLRRWRRTSVIVCGLEAHVCVLQTVLDLQASGRQAFVCTDAVSCSQREQIRWAFERMARAGAILTGVMSVLYELLGDASHPSFRGCLELAKAIEQ